MKKYVLLFALLFGSINGSMLNAFGKYRIESTRLATNIAKVLKAEAGKLENIKPVKPTDLINLKDILLKSQPSILDETIADTSPKSDFTAIDQKTIITNLRDKIKPVKLSPFVRYKRGPSVAESLKPESLLHNFMIFCYQNTQEIYDNFRGLMKFDDLWGDIPWHTDPVIKEATENIKKTEDERHKNWLELVKVMKTEKYAVPTKEKLQEHSLFGWNQKESVKDYLSSWDEKAKKYPGLAIASTLMLVWLKHRDPLQAYSAYLLDLRDAKATVVDKPERNYKKDKENGEDGVEDGSHGWQPEGKVTVRPGEEVVMSFDESGSVSTTVLNDNHRPVWDSVINGMKTSLEYLLPRDFSKIDKKSSELQKIALMDLAYKRFEIMPDWSKALTPEDAKAPEGETNEARYTRQNKIMTEYVELLKKPKNQLKRDQVTQAVEFMRPFFLSISCYASLLGVPVHIYPFGNQVCSSYFQLVPDELMAKTNYQNIGNSGTWCRFIAETIIGSIEDNGSGHSRERKPVGNIKSADQAAQTVIDYWLTGKELNSFNKETNWAPNIWKDLRTSQTFVDEEKAGKTNPYVQKVFPFSSKDFDIYKIIKNPLLDFKGDANSIENQKSQEKEKQLATWKRYFLRGFSNLELARKNLISYGIETLTASIPKDEEKRDKTAPMSPNYKNFLDSIRSVWEAIINERLKSSEGPLFKDYMETYFKPFSGVDVPQSVAKAKEENKETEHCLTTRKFILNFKLESAVKVTDGADFTLEELCGLYKAPTPSNAKDPAVIEAMASLTKPRKLPSIRLTVKEHLGEDPATKQPKFSDTLHEAYLDLNDLDINDPEVPDPKKPNVKLTKLNQIVFNRCCTRWSPIPPGNEPAEKETWINDIKSLFKIEFYFEDKNMLEGSTKFTYAKSGPFEDAEVSEHDAMTCTDFWLGQYTGEYFRTDTLASAQTGKKPLESKDTHMISIKKGSAEFFSPSLQVDFPVIQAKSQPPLFFQSVFKTNPVWDPTFNLNDQTAVDFGTDNSKCPTFIKSLGSYMKFLKFGAQQSFKGFVQGKVTIQKSQDSKLLSNIIENSATNKIQPDNDVSVPITVIKIPIGGYLNNLPAKAEQKREEYSEYQKKRAAALKLVGAGRMNIV